jgi:nicotinamidase-related amidase
MSNTPRRALLVIDVQNAYVTGGFLIEHPPVAQSLANIGRAMDAAREAGMPIVVVQHNGFGQGSEGWQLHPVVASRAHDHHIDKPKPSVFTGTDLAVWLEQHRIDTVSIVGYMSHNCNAATIFEAHHRGLNAEFLSDATGALPYANRAGSASAEEIHRVFSVVFESNFAAVLSTDEWLQAVATGAAPRPENPVASNRRALNERSDAAGSSDDAGRRP